MTTTSTTSKPSLAKWPSQMAASFRLITLGVILVTGCVTAFAPPPAHLQSPLGKVLRDGTQASRTRVERAASFTLGDSGATSATSTSERARFGWTLAKAAQAGTARRAAPAQQQRNGDWSKLFAAPEAQPALGNPLVGLSRGCASLAGGSCGSLPILFGMVGLVYAFVPLVAAQSLAAWVFGRVMYGCSMRGADASKRLPAGFVGYMSMFLVVGGVSFMNGLKAIALLSI